MKQALFILAAFLLVAPSMLRGQDFEVVSPSNGILELEQYSGSYTKIDTFIIIKNKTGSPLSLKYKFVFQNGWQAKFSSTTILSPFEEKVFPLVASPNEFGNYRGKIEFTDSITTTPINLKASFIPNLLDSTLMANTSLLRIYDKYIPVGSKSCFPLIAENKTNKPINIYSISTEKLANFLLDTVFDLPSVILPGEKITVAQLCFEARQPNGSFSLDGNLSTSAKYSHRDDLIIRYYPSTGIDTILAKKCLVVTDTNALIGPVLIGGSITKPVTLKSNRYLTQFIDGVTFTPDAEHAFKVVGNPFPLAVDSLGTASFQIEFSPNITEPSVKYRYATVMTFSGKCAPDPIDLSGLVILPTADSISTPLFPDKEYVLGMSSSAPSFSQDFHFVNNGLTNTKIVSVGLADPSPEFIVTNITPTNTLPFTLLPGEKMTVSVLFTPSQVGKVFFNQLIITTEQGIQSVSYPLQGIRTTTSGVQESSEPTVSVNLTPNPTSSSVTVSIKGAGQIEGGAMTDELGKNIFYYNQPQQPEWKWELNPQRVARGTYFIRINGKTPEGKPFVVSRRLVVE